MTQEMQQIKIMLPPNEHDQVRVAAAMRRKTMAGFCRDLVAAEAGRVTRDLGLLARGKADHEEPDGGADAKS